MVLEDWSNVLLTCVAGTTIIIVVLEMIRRRKPAMCENKNSLEGKTVVITGANTGIGKEVAKDLAKRKARVIMACRNVELGEIAALNIANEIGQHVQDKLIVNKLDLASFKSIRNFANEMIKNEKRIDILINNAGVFGCPFSHTEDGLEMTFGVNHIGHFLLSNLLLDKLINSAPSRIIVVSSLGHKIGKIDFKNLNAEKSYNRLTAYNQSKLANMLFAYNLNKRLPKGVTVNSVHPGVVETDISRHLLKYKIFKLIAPVFAYFFMMKPMEGAQTVIYLATSDRVADISGKFFADCKMKKLTANTTDDETAEKLWKISEILCHLKSDK